MARGERLQFRRYASRLEVRVDGRFEYRDALDLEPARMNLNALGALEGCDYAASGVLVNPGCANTTSLDPNVASGRTAAGHLWVRALAQSGPELDRIIAGTRDAWCSKLKV